MTAYRLHFLLDGRMLNGQAFTAENDRHAKGYVEGRLAGRAAKLWSLDRLVRTYPAGPPGAAWRAMSDRRHRADGALVHAIAGGGAMVDADPRPR